MNASLQHPRADNLVVAIASILLSVFALSLGDAVIKLLSVNLPVWQVYVIRSVLALPVLLVLLARRSVRLLPHNLFWASIRSLLLAGMWVAYYASLPHLQLSLAAAAYYTSPLFITLFSAMLAGERVGSTGWLAIVLGFAGVIVMLRPDASGFNAWTLLPIAAAICYALAMILTRTKCRDDHPLALSFALNVAFILVGGVASIALLALGLDDGTVAANPFLLRDWATLDASAWLALSVLAVAMLAGSIFAAAAYQSGAASTVSAFDYSYLLFSAVWGLLFFAELPDPVTVLGMGMIVVAGIMAARRKRPVPPV